MMQGVTLNQNGKHVHLQMKKGQTGHWYLPVGRFGDAMSKLHENDHLVATTSPVPTETSCCDDASSHGSGGGSAPAAAVGTSHVSKAATTAAAALTAE